MLNDVYDKVADSLAKSNYIASSYQLNNFITTIVYPLPVQLYKFFIEYIHTVATCTCSYMFISSYVKLTPFT